MVRILFTGVLQCRLLSTTRAVPVNVLEEDGLSDWRSETRRPSMLSCARRSFGGISHNARKERERPQLTRSCDDKRTIAI